MPSIKFSVPHNLGQEVAVARLTDLIDRIKSRYGDQVSDLQEQWQGPVLAFGFKTYGFNVTGRMTVQPASVDFDCQIPLAALMFKGKIEQTIRDELNKRLA
jgi:hypothetical protein